MIDSLHAGFASARIFAHWVAIHKAVRPGYVFGPWPDHFSAVKFALLNFRLRALATVETYIVVFISHCWQISAV